MVIVSDRLDVWCSVAAPICTRELHAVGNRRISHTEDTDVDLVQRYRTGGDPDVLEVLIGRYRRFARAKARGYFLIGGDSDDVEQEALIGLYKAVRDFRPEHQSSFRAFAELCIKRQIITAIKTATRQKHQPLNSYLSISGPRPGDDGADSTVDDVLACRTEVDPCETIVSGERVDDIQRSVVAALSGLEVDVLELYVEGRSYQEIGVALGRHTKSIDNALQRIKRKLDGELRSVEHALPAQVA